MYYQCTTALASVSGTFCEPEPSLRPEDKFTFSKALARSASHNDGTHFKGGGGGGGGSALIFVRTQF